MEITVVNEVITIRVVTLDGIRLPSDGLELLSNLCESDGMFNGTCLSNTKLRKALEDAGYIRTNSRGSSYATDKLKQLYDAIEHAWYYQQAEE